MKRLVLLGVLAVAGLVWIAAGEYLDVKGGTKLSVSVTDSGDTAKVYKINQFTGRDSFDYIDTFHGSWMKSADSVVTWTSPLQVRRVLVAATVDTTVIESILVDLGTNKTGVEYDVPPIAFTRASLIDSLVANFNAVTTIKDTVVAQDSGTYIKIVGKIAQDNLEGAARWTIDVGPAASLTEGDSTFTTIAMVCDSMVASINEADTIGNHVTAANSGDTVYTVTADKKGVTYTLSPGDSAQDTNVTVANATSKTRDSSTFVLTPTYGWKTMTGQLVVNPELSAHAGLGESDSCIVRIYSQQGSTRHKIDSVLANALPCTVDVVIPQATGDSLFREFISVEWIITDTCTDTNATVEYPCFWQFKLK